VGRENFSLLAHRYATGNIYAIPLRAFDIPASWVRFGLCIGCDHAPKTEKETTMSDTKKPAAHVKLHPVSAAIWRNQNQKGTFYSVTFERSFKDEAGKWQSSSTFNASDLLLLAKVADLAETKIRELRSADRQSEQPEEEAA